MSMPRQHVGQEEAALGVARRPHGEDLGAAGHALAAEAVVVERGDQAGHERAVADEVGHVRAARTTVSTVRAIWPANSGWFTSRPGVDHRDEAARAAADGGDRLAGPDGVVGPGELDAGVGVEPVELVDRDARACRVALHVGHARVARAARATAAAPEGTVAAITPVRSNALGSRAEARGARRPPRPCPRACARPRADAPGASERAIRASSPPEADGGRGARALRQRQRNDAGARRVRLRPRAPRAAARARRSPSRPARAQQGAAPHRGVPQAPLSAHGPW